MEEVIKLKAQMYDLMAAKQNIEMQMQQVNQKIVELSKAPKEQPKE